jgi:16S rRNA G966 N2-methylase RsmD
MWQQALTILAEHPLLAQPHTQMIVQIDPKEWQAMALPRWQELDRRRYGKTELIFFEAVDPAEI